MNGISCQKFDGQGPIINADRRENIYDSNNNSLNKLLEMLPDSRRNAEDITRLAKEKVIYYDCAFAASNVMLIVSRDVCNTPSCIYSKKAVGEPNGPSKLQACVLNQWTESGYTCE